jgi:hypothetical protein
MHLIQGANNLGAEIELAAAATVLRSRSGTLLTDETDLIECGRYGEPERFSDPHIGAEVNALARLKAHITLANPVGLCIAGLTVTGWQTPDGSNPLDYWTVLRGTKEKAVRAEYTVPKSKGFTVGDITIKLTGLATRLGTIDAPSVDCPAVGAGGLEAVADRSFESVLARHKLPTRGG